MSGFYPDLTELRAALRADVGSLAEALLGSRNKAASTRNTWRWGSKGSFALEVHGARKGLWYSHEGQEGDDPLGLIQHARGDTFPEALAYAWKWTGLAEPADDAGDDERQDARREQLEADRQARRVEQEAAEAAETAADHAKRIAVAQQIAAGTVSLAGTLGEYYAKQGRGIPPSAAGWPDAVRFHPHNRSLVAIATATDGTVQAVQQVYLTEDGAKIPGTPDHPTKRTNGVTKLGAMVRLPGQPGGPVLIAEGPETGLAAWSSTGFETLIALGGIRAAVPCAGRRLVICRDDDARYSAADKKLARTVTEWRRAGVEVAVATPWQVRRRDKSDLADVILYHGCDAVRARIMAALEPARAAVVRVPVKEARRQVAATVGAFFDRVDAISAARAELDAGTAAAADPDSFTHGVRVSTGVGKSAVARYQIAEKLAAMRERGDTRNMVLAMPTHALGDEQATRFMELPKARAAGLTAAIWRGRAAPDPRHPDYANPLIKRDDKTPMCGDLERVKDAQEIGLSAQQAVCKRRIEQPDGTKATVTCPLFDRCSYQRQNELRADLWVTSHDLLFHEKPAVIGEVAAVVVDEAAWRKGLIGAEGRHITLSLDALAENCGSGRLASLRRQLLDTLRNMPDGPVRRDALGWRELLNALRTMPNRTDRRFRLRAPRLTADSAAEAIKLEYARKVDPLHPGQSREERRAAMEQADGNRTIARLAMAWNALRELLTPGGPDASGWLALGVEKTRDGPVRVLRLKGRKKVADGWKAPTLLLDALLPVELVQPFWRSVELVADVQAAMPHQHVRQVVDRAYALSMLAPPAEKKDKAGHKETEVDPKEVARRLNRLRDLRALLIREARRYAPGGVLVVMQQAVETAMQELEPLPPNVMTAHHNNIAGRDEWKRVRALIVVGRTMPPPSGVERIAEALTGAATAAPMEWYERADAVREMADGSTIPAEADRHTDPLAELARWQIAEGELVQIIGRPRGVNRTAADPVDVLVLTDTPLPMPLTGTLDAADLEPSTADHMIAAGGMAFENPTDAAAAYPFMWATRNAAKMAFKRERLGSVSYRESYIGERPQPRRVSYQLAGAGQKPAVAFFDPALCPDPAEFLTEKLGKLAWCRVEDVPPPDPPAAPPAEPPSTADAASVPEDEPFAAEPPVAAPGVVASRRVSAPGVPRATPASTWWNGTDKTWTGAPPWVPPDPRVGIGGD